VKEKTAEVFGLEDCELCEMVKAELEELDITVKVRDLRKAGKKVKAQYEKQNAAPVVLVEGKYIVTPRQIISGEFARNICFKAQDETQ
jgi:glutaredoxin